MVGGQRTVRKRQEDGPLVHLLDFLGYENTHLCLWVAARAKHLASNE